MSPASTCKTADFFVLRTPSLPLDALSLDSQATHQAAHQAALPQVLRDLVGRADIREALALASPDLAARLGAWLEGSLHGKDARNIEQSLVKYLSRMSSRCTPFGLFAGVSTGAWGSASSLSVECWKQARKFVRLDWGVLESLVDRLMREPEVRSFMLYRPNSSLYLCGGWYRYLERRDQPGQGRGYHLEAVEATPHLDFVLQQAETGASLEALTTSLAQYMKVEPAVAHAFLDQLIDAEVLCGDLTPSLTDPDPLKHVVAALQAVPAMAPKTADLVALHQELRRLQAAPVGSHPTGYPSLLPCLVELDIPAATRDLIQVDLFRPAPGLTLAPAVRVALEEGAETLRQLTPAPAELPLDLFRVAFEKRYGTRWMPLLEVLDEESGIGFDGAAPMDSALLQDLPFPSPVPVRRLFQRDLFLLAQLSRWQGSRVWELADADMVALTPPDPHCFPTSFAALVSLGASSTDALDRGEFQFYMEGYSGPTAARWLGRFASGDPGLKDLLQNHLRKEESLRPDALFAEVIHVPEGRMGNVLARPSLREYEIPFLAAPGVSRDKVILPSDLFVTVRGDRVFLASARLGREVFPRLSSAHNFGRGQVVYRFLAQLQDQDGRPGGWSWGALAEQPFLPRVVRGRHVLSKARWRFEASALKAALASSNNEVWGAFQQLREARGLPRFVLLVEADNSLRVDLDQVLWVEALHHLVSARPAFTLMECFPASEQALVTSAEGRFAHELVIPFEAPAASQPKRAPLHQMANDSAPRAFPPGSEWLYLKLYCGPASADRLLLELQPLILETQAIGLFDRWHFIRYRDPAPHLRLRFHGQPSCLLAELLPRFQSHWANLLAQGFIAKIQVDTFEPELERYGGPLGFALAEAWFCEDSQRILKELAGGMTLEERWRAGLKNVDAIWAALGLDVAARKTLAQASRAGFRKEFGDAGEGAVEIGKKFRGFRKELEPGFPLATGSLLAPGSAGLDRIRATLDQNLLQVELPSLAGSLAHMHLNRLLRSNHRETEWVIMEFLTRLYESQLARFP